LLVEQLSLSPGDYLLAVMQDRDAYSRAGAPPVYENVSDDYALELRAQTLDPTREVEPNDTPRNPSLLSPGAAFVGKLGFMRDVDVLCTSVVGKLRFKVEDSEDPPRPRESVLQVKPLSGPDQDVPVRVHRNLQGVPRSPRDALSPWQGNKVDGSGDAVCLELSLVPNPWGPNPAPDVAPASETQYVVRVEAL
jgi:hypothetical protein